MIRKIITIDANACNGCGLCVSACHEGAIGMKDGKAVLLRDDYCDGLGDCLPVCPMNAITFEEREALPYDEEAVLANMKAKETRPTLSPLPCGCPGSAARALTPLQTVTPCSQAVPARLAQWPVQIQLVPVNAPYFEGADILVAADCSAFAYGDFHAAFMTGKVTLIGCPKLDPVDYAEKLTAIFAQNTITSVTVTRMSVPCCGGIEQAVKRAVAQSGKDIPVRIVTISTDGKIL
ncbi:MAG: Ferredoxin-type protein NapF [Desulfovibrio sp.]